MRVVATAIFTFSSKGQCSKYLEFLTVSYMEQKHDLLSNRLIVNRVKL